MASTCSWIWDGWDHPFPKGSFKITSDDQIRTIRTLGLTQVRYFPTKSDPADKDGEGSSNDDVRSAVDLGLSSQAAQQRLLTEADALRDQRREQLLAQQRSLAQCERRFDEATRLYHRVLTEASAKPIAGTR